MNKKLQSISLALLTIIGVSIFLINADEAKYTPRVKIETNSVQGIKGAFEYINS